jgi:RHS repeat-associated protein
MQTLHRSLRKAVSMLFTLLLIFALFSSSFATPASDTFTYDANGNMINGSGFIFVYNDANQLVKIINESNSSIVAEYFYDTNSQRVKKLEGNVTTYYIGDYVETKVDGSSVDNTSYYFANNERVGRKDPDGSNFYYHGDHLGSTSVVTDESGAQSEKVNYYPYGSLKERIGEGSTYLFTDQEFDSESGLYYYDARYYNPELTRFTQPDTIMQDVYNPQNLNKYAYVLNNPLKYTDPTGHGVNLAIEHIIESAKNLAIGALEPDIPVLTQVEAIGKGIFDFAMIFPALAIDENDPNKVEGFYKVRDFGHQFFFNYKTWAGGLALGSYKGLVHSGVIDDPVVREAGGTEIMAAAAIFGEGCEIVFEETVMSPYTILLTRREVGRTPYNRPIMGFGNPIQNMRERGEEAKIRWINYFYKTDETIEGEQK